MLAALIAFAPLPPVAGDDDVVLAAFHPPVRLSAAGEIIDSGEEWGHSGPTLVDIDADGDRDLLVGDFSGKFRLFVNEGTDRAPKYLAGKWLRAGSGVAEVPIY